MSRSFKLPIYKDKGWKRHYWRWIRSRLNTELKSQLYNDLDNLELPDPKTIINDYDYSDYTFDESKDIDRCKLKKLKGDRRGRFKKDVCKPGKNRNNKKWILKWMRK